MFYQESRTAKASAIGTIMPWSGGLSVIPDGWIACNGESIVASEFPLLAQTIGDTYNQGTSNFTGNFPNYSGTIKLPNLNNKALMDIEEKYFVGGTEANTGRIADADTDAKTLLSAQIGTNESQSVVKIFTDVYTDLVWEMPSTMTDPANTNYFGRISGNTSEKGDGQKDVYVAGRKLGRKHIKYHNHSGNYNTLQVQNVGQPGYGVIPYHPVEYTIRFQSIDNHWNTDDFTGGDTYYFGWTDDILGADDGDSWSGFATRFNRPGIQVGSGWAGFPNEAYDLIPATTAYTQDSYGSTDNLYQLWWPDGGADEEVPNGFNIADPGKVIAKVTSESPPVNLTPNIVNYTPITEQFLVTPNRPTGPRIDDSNPVKYRVGSGGDITIPMGVRNYYLENDPDSSVRQTMMSNIGYNFTTNTASISSDYIVPHIHDDIVINFVDKMKPQSNITANVELPIQAELIDNNANKNALQIDMNVTQPSLQCLYIIRAY